MLVIIELVMVFVAVALVLAILTANVLIQMAMNLVADIITVIYKNIKDLIKKSKHLEVETK
mgnify:CR=1 FL=1